MNLETRARDVVRPGKWLTVKRFVPTRFHRLLAPGEALVFGWRGLRVELAGNEAWFDPATTLPIETVFRKSTQETLEDRAFMAAVLDALQPGDVFYDVGGHVGLYTVGAGLIVGRSGKVVVFEPTPKSAALIRKNVALNGLTDRVQVEEAAVSDRLGTVTFAASGDSSQNAIAAFDPFRGSAGARPQTIEVRTVVLDDYFDPARRSVVKIDIEGAELLALRQAKKALASDARIFVELHAWGWSSEKEGWEELNELARGSGRRVAGIDGRPIDRPSHQRVELRR
jgi:FkbM family methyltransferase